MTMRRGTGFTMMEMLIVIVIMGVVAGLAVPTYFRTVEQARSNEAKTNLNIIHMGQKLYYFNNNSVFGASGATTVAAVNSALGTDMSAAYYTTVSMSISGSGLTARYVARLTRNAVQGGAGTKFFEYDYTQGAANPTLNEGGAY